MQERKTLVGHYKICCQTGKLITKELSSDEGQIKKGTESII